MATYFSFNAPPIVTARPDLDCAWRILLDFQRAAAMPFEFTASIRAGAF